MATTKILPVNLTDRRAEVLELILKHQETNGYPPSFRELQEEMGIASVSTLAFHLERLRDGGYVTWSEKIARTLKVTPKGKTTLARRVLL